MERQIDERVERAIDERVFPGCVVGVVFRNGQRAILPFGRFTYDSNSLLVKEDSIFDIASITKSIPTSSLALRLIGQGRLSLENKLTDFIPEYQNPKRVLIKHLLTHTLMDGLKLSSFKERGPEGILDIIMTSTSEEEPGSRYLYTNTASILTGLVVERIMGESLDKCADSCFFNPLGMTRTNFNPPDMFLDEIVPTEYDEWRGKLIHGEVHDESAWVLSKKMVVGSAGLFSNVPDLLNFLEMLLNRGTIGGKEYISPDVIELIQTNQIQYLGGWTGLGWHLNDPDYTGRFTSETTFVKNGFTGCTCAGDIERGVGYVILSNYIYPKRKPNSELINQVRRDIADIIFSDIPKI